MARKKLPVRNPPRDAENLQQLIEEISAQSEDVAVAEIQRLPTKRIASLAIKVVGKFELSLPSQRIAALVQSRGYIAPQPCTRCAANEGPFSSCVLLDNHLQGQCTNCYSTRPNRKVKGCSHATEDRIQAASTWIKEHKTKSTENKRAFSSGLGLAVDQAHEAKRLCATSEWKDSPTIDPLVHDGNIHIIGTLQLPHPARVGLDATLVKQILSLLPHLRKLDGRDLQGLMDRIDIKQAFKTFKKDEERAWRESGHTPERGSTLVCPSGSIDSVISHHLHQPSFTTSFEDGGEVGDKSNCCIAMVMGNGFEEGETLLFDHLHRRSKNSDGLEAYPPPVLDTHERFTHQIMTISAAKVEVVYGQHVQKRILKTMRCSILPLWGYLNGIFLVILHESNFQNEDEKFLFRKVLLFATHPQRLFYESRGSAATIRQDLLFQTANHIADLKIRFDPQYYRSKKWLSKMPSIYERGLQKANELTRYFSLQDVEERGGEHPQVSEAVNSYLGSEAGEWHSYFSRRRHSNEVSRQLLPGAIIAIQSAIVASPIDWKDPSDFPPEVLQWFSGQKDVLFYYGPVSNSTDIAFALERCKATAEISEVQNLDVDKNTSHGLRHMLHHLMLAQHRHLTSISGSRQDLIYNRIDGSTIQTVCPCGRYKTIDRRPRFTCAQKDGYVMMERRGCRSQECSAKGQQFMQPMSETLRGVQNRKEALRSAEPTDYDIEPLFYPALRKRNDLPSTTTVVDLWCVRCKERSVFHSPNSSKRENIYIDNNARWTLGRYRPLYIVRESICHHCIGGGRLVPVNVDVPFTTPKQLRSFISVFGKYDDLVKAALLDQWPVTLRELRVKE